MKAKINNKEISVRIINQNYNEYSVEVEILEGTFKGKYTIVDKKDLIKPSVAKILKVAKAEIIKSNIASEDLENNSICELLQDTCKIIVEYAKELITISSKEWNIMDSIYCDYTTIEEAKEGILYAVIENELLGVNTTISAYKKGLLKEIEG